MFSIRDRWIETQYVVEEAWDTLGRGINEEIPSLILNPFNVVLVLTCNKESVKRDYVYLPSHTGVSRVRGCRLGRNREGVYCLLKHISEVLTIS